MQTVENEYNISAATKQAVRPVYNKKRHLKKVVPLILFFCLLIAIGSVLLIPLLVGGTAAEATEEMVFAQEETSVIAIASISEAEEELGFVPALPAQLPTGYALTAFRILDGNVFEAEYSLGKEVVLYRTASGNEDLSGDFTEYAFTQTETVDGVAREYAGVAKKKLNLAVWANENFSYAVVSKEGMGTAGMKVITESVA